MRTISAASMAALSKTEAVEPVNFVDIDWSGHGLNIRYSDQEYPGVQGKIIELANLENVVDISGNTSSQSVTVKLNDTDGQIKHIIDQYDIHKKPVNIRQWFKALPSTDSFLVFHGEISSPIIWDEADRTLTFNVVSKLEDLEVGFSAEEGAFSFVPPDLVGKPWPLTFGYVQRVPALQINKAPSGISASQSFVGSSDTNPASKDRIITNNIAAFRKAIDSARSCFIVAEQAYNTADDLRFKQITQNDPLSNNQFVDYRSAIAYYQQQGDDLTKKGNDYISQANDILLTGLYTVYDPQQGTPSPPATIPISGGQALPQGTGLALNIGGATHYGIMFGTQFQVTQVVNPNQSIGIVYGGPTEVQENTSAVKYLQEVSSNTIWIGNPGSLVTIDEQTIYPVRYVGSLNWVQIKQVWALKNNVLVVVPPDYYSIQQENFASIKATFLTFGTPLSSRLNEGWSDQIWCDILSPIGPNVVDIIKYIVQTYTYHTFDPVSFNHCHAMQIPFPANFALLSRTNVIQTLQEIAFQSRMAIWYNDGLFYLKYLPEQMAPVETFVDDDIEFKSFKLTGTETENVVTKLSFTWRPDYYTDPYTLILRSNVNKYGLIEQTYDCYIYNNIQLVQKSAVFWTIRLSNTWKRITFDTFLTKLKVETYDMILMNLAEPWISNGPIVGMVESTNYDSDNNRISLQVWIPVRFGEMTQYPFAMPAGISEVLVYPTPKDNPGGGGVGSSSSGSLMNQIPIAGATGKTFKTQPNFDQGSNAFSHLPIYDWPFPPVSDVNNVAPSGPTSFTPSTALNPEFNPRITVTPTQKSTHKQWNIKDFSIPDFTLETPATYPGYVQGKISGNLYTVAIYPQGIAGAPVMVQVKQLSGLSSNNIPSGTGAIVVKNVWGTKNAAGIVIQSVEFTMNVPTWLFADDEE